MLCNCIQLHNCHNYNWREGSLESFHNALIHVTIWKRNCRNWPDWKSVSRRRRRSCRPCLPWHWWSCSYQRKCWWFPAANWLLISPHSFHTPKSRCFLNSQTPSDQISWKKKLNRNVFTREIKKKSFTGNFFTLKKLELTIQLQYYLANLHFIHNCYFINSWYLAPYISFWQRLKITKLYRLH